MATDSAWFQYGHLLATAALLVSFFFQGAALFGRITRLEAVQENNVSQLLFNEGQILAGRSDVGASIAALRGELRSDLSAVQAKLDRLVERGLRR